MHHEAIEDSMTFYSVRVVREATALAQPQLVYRVLIDSSRYPHWSRIGSYRSIRDAAQPPSPVGEVRAFRTGVLDLHEEIIAAVPYRLLEYRLLSGLPLRGYRGRTELSYLGNGNTRILWGAQFEVRSRLAKLFWAAFFRRVLGGMARDLATESNRLSGR